MKGTFIPKHYRPVPIGSKLDDTHQTSNPMNFDDYLFSKKDINKVNTICLCSKNDYVIQVIERNISAEKPIQIFFLEELYESWSFICRDGRIMFVTTDSVYGNKVIQPKLIYYRSAFCDPESKYHFKLMELINLLSLWQGEILCHPIEHKTNNSKPLQMVKVISTAIKSMGKNHIKIPQSFIVKGDKHWKEINTMNIIVKSISGIRSEVVDNQVFSQWDKQAMNDLPVLFQQAVEGVDIRVHVLNNKFYAKKIVKQNEETYRYNTRQSILEDCELSNEMKQFCENLSTLEKTKLAGIDLMVTPSQEYYCFELNPGPGWSAYHENDNKEGDSFLSHMIRCLENGKIS